jgi:PAS domain S-box-containing protein
MDPHLLETVPGLIYRIRATPPFEVEFVSDELAALTGYSVEQFLGSAPEIRWTDLVHPEDLPRAYDVIERVLTGELAELEFRYRRPDGSEGWLLTRARKLDGPDGKSRLHGAAIDVTERHLSEELRRRAEAEEARRSEVEASRSRIVAAEDEARRRLAADLHDGAQQRLVSVALDLAEVERGLDAEPGRARRLLATARLELARGLEELRELARGVHPATLTERGLPVALEGLVGRSPVPVDLSVAVHGRPPAAVETTAYYVVAESLTNVAKHARAKSATVEVATDGESLTIVIEDDGVGGATIDEGFGLRGLADRVETHGGRLWVRSEAGRGTSVKAELPLEGSRPASV